MESLNNREIATIFWLAVLIIWVFSKKDARVSFLPVISAFTNKLVLIPFGLFILYNSMIIWFLRYVGFWDSNQIKNTIIWFFTAGIVSFFQLPNIEKDPLYFRKAITDNLKIIVFFEFIISFYVFSLPVELIFVPLVTFLALLSAISERDKKNKIVTKLLHIVLTLIGLIIVIYTIYKLIINYSEFAQKQTLYDFSLPTILSIFLLPFIYLLHVYMVYEGVFRYIDFLITDKKICRYAKKTALIKYNLDLSRLKQWEDILRNEHIVKSSDIDETHKELARLIMEEKTPPIVPSESGWSPYSVNQVFADKGLRTDSYKKLYDNEWAAISPYLKIGEGSIPNDIIYSITGNKKAVTRLAIKVNISEASYAKLAHEKLFEFASILYFNIFEKELDEKYKGAILNSKNLEGSIHSKNVKVVTEHWPTKKGYDITFSIENSE